MSQITLTSKRQATFPKQLCEEMNIRAGDRVAVERSVIRGETLWILRPAGADWTWIGSAPPARTASHSMQAIRASIARGRQRPRR